MWQPLSLFAHYASLDVLYKLQASQPVIAEFITYSIVARQNTAEVPKEYRNVDLQWLSPAL
jgi:hypothetical protein